MKTKPKTRKVKKQVLSSPKFEAEVLSKQATRKIESPKRIFSLDILRMSVVFTMIFTHVASLVFLFNGNENKVVFYLSLLGGLVSFSSFLFLSGAGLYLSLIRLKSEEVNGKRRGLILKSLKILLFYYLLTLLSVFVLESLDFNDTREFSNQLVDILLVFRFGQFTEFIIALIIFFIITALFQPVLRWLSEKWFRLAALIPVTYALGYFLYDIDLNSRRLNNWKSILAGHGDIHVFPVLFYFPVFILGILWAKLLFTKGSKVIYYNIFALISVTLLSLSFLTYQYTELEIFNFSVYDSRFPPSIGFLIASLTFVSVTLLIAEFLTKVKISKLSNTKYLVNFVSKNAFNYFILHTFLLLAFRLLLDREFDKRRFSNPFEVFAVYFGVIILCTILIILFELIKLPHFQKAKAVSRIFAAIILVAISLALGFRVNYADEINPTDQLDIYKDIALTQENAWWDDRYSNYFEIETNSVSSADSLYLIEFNHLKLIEKKKSFSENDLHIVSFADGKFVELETHIIDPKKEKTKIFFKIKNAKTSDFRLILYTGYEDAKVGPKLNLEKVNLEQNTKLSLDEDQSIKHDLDIALDKKWYLKNNDKNSRISLKLDLSAEENNIKAINYIIPEKGINKILNSENKVFEDTINVREWNEGKYSLQIFAVDTTENQIELRKSKISEFYVSQPLYVVWSLDWEGFGVNQFDLDDIVDISTKYEMPIVQYFNPRIYLENSSGSGVNKGAASYYTSWVLGRKAKGDEIGLHIHLYPDLIDGVEKHFATDTTPDDDADEPVVDQIEPIYQPAGLVGIGRTENSLAAYSREDLVKIFQWSLDKFKENNLPFPTSFRSGAWMSSTNVLSALEGVGIAIDSSGRTGGDLNPSIPSSNDIPWSLSATTYPYKPDKGNINTWSSGDRFNVWEFPNNGADSYWFSKEELISRFDANYKGKNYVVKRAQVVTYLSHPHGFKQFDSAKIRAALEHASKFKYKDDNGPVVFGTFENIFKEWPKENINGN